MSQKEVRFIREAIEVVRELALTAEQTLGKSAGRDAFLAMVESLDPSFDNFAPIVVMALTFNGALRAACGSPAPVDWQSAIAEQMGYEALLERRNRTKN